MKFLLFFDTETTGLINFKLPIDHEDQPRLVQLAAILTDEVGNELSSINLIVKPIDYNGNTFEIPKNVSDIHGITTEIALKVGVYRTDVVKIFYSMKNQVDLSIAHNASYDAFIMKSELTKRDTCWIEEKYEYFCTMKASTDIFKIVKNAGGKYKFPKLQEAYQLAFGKEFENAHNALADVRATKELYFWILEYQKKSGKNGGSFSCSKTMNFAEFLSR